MSFAMVPLANQFIQQEAEAAYQEAIESLSDSDMATSSIEELRQLRAVITIRIGPGLVDKFIHPKTDDDLSIGGIIERDSNCTLNVIDKARYRPEVRWVTDATEQYGFIWLNPRKINVPGTISAPVAPIHEMGQPHQFFFGPRRLPWCSQVRPETTGRPRCRRDRTECRPRIAATGAP